MEDNFVVDEKVILIVGGMGPMAGIECFKYVVDNCYTNGTDQDNLNTIVVSYPEHIENRAEYVLKKSEHNPALSVVSFLRPQLRALSSCFKKIIMGVPCITFHCPSIFSVFVGMLKSEFPQVEVVSIVSSTVNFIRDSVVDVTRIGILSTDGTRSAKPFATEMEANGISAVYLTDDQQDIVTDCIYNTHWGVKSQQFDLSRVRLLLCSIMDQLIAEGSQAIILGCTEIPLAIHETQYKGIPVLNPSWIMARNLVLLADASKLKRI